MNGSDPGAAMLKHDRAGFFRPQLLLYLVLLLAATWTSLLEPHSTPLAWSATEASVVPADREELALPATGINDVQKTSIQSLDRIERVSWLRFSVPLQAGSPLPPYALFVSGPFSAEVWFDGHFLGSKGNVGADPASEIPGPIDSVFYIPESLSTPGDHFLAIRVSSHHLGYQAGSLVHRLSIGAFQSDPRRQLRYYSLPLILSGGFAVLILQFCRAGFASGSRTSVLLALAGTFLLLQLGSEVSRSLVSYSYDWHLLRSLAIWVFAVGAAFSINLLVSWRLFRRTISVWTTAALLAACIAALFSGGFDNKSVNAVMVLSVAPVLAVLTARGRQDLLVLASSALGATWLLVGFAHSGALLDRTFHVSALVYFSFVWIWITRGDEPIEPPAPSQPDRRFFTVKHTGRMERIPVSEVLYVKAEGNFASLCLADGRRVLHHQRLGQIMESPPPEFSRVHRSYAVNREHLEGLRSIEGSRYFAQMIGGEEVPVSRFQAQVVRELLEKGC